MQAVPLSKQVNRINIESVCMETGLPTGSIMKYNFFVNPFTSRRTVCNNTLQCRPYPYNAGAG